MDYYCSSLERVTQVLGYSPASRLSSGAAHLTFATRLLLKSSRTRASSPHFGISTAK